MPACTLALNRVWTAVNAWAVKINLEHSSVVPNTASECQIRSGLYLLRELLWSLILQLVIDPPK